MLVDAVQQQPSFAPGLGETQGRVTQSVGKWDNGCGDPKVFCTSAPSAQLTLFRVGWTGSEHLMEQWVSLFIAEGLDEMAFKGVYQPKLFYDFILLP